MQREISPPVCTSEVIVLKLAQFKWNCVEFCRSVIHSKNSGVLRKGWFVFVLFFFTKLWEPKEIPLASCYWTKCSKHLCVGVLLCTIGNICVSIASFGEGNVISIVLLIKRKMCRERINLSFSSNIFFVVFFYHFIFKKIFFISCFEHCVFRKQKTKLASTSLNSAIIANACLLRH